MTAERLPIAWYREPWPWLVMLGPAVVVVAGVITMVIAFRTSDGLVADDYYKRGLMVNRVMEREARARTLGIAAEVMFNGERNAVRVLLASNAPLPEALRLTLVHPTRGQADQAIELRHAGPSLYEGRLRAPSNAAWRIALEDGAATWRVTGRWKSTSEALVFTLGAVD
jgi:uncharacterized protein